MMRTCETHLRSSPVRVLLRHCFCDCRPSSSIKAALNAFLPLACSTFFFILLKLHVGALKTVCRSLIRLMGTWFLPGSYLLMQTARADFIPVEVSRFWTLTSWKCRTIGLSDVFFPSICHWLRFEQCHSGKI